MTVNFRYKAKQADQSIRGILFEAKRWLETEVRIPLSEDEEKILDIEVATKDGFEKLEESIVREAAAGGHLFKDIAGRAERLGEKVEADVVADVQKAETKATGLGQKIKAGAKKIAGEVKEEIEKIEEDLGKKPEGSSEPEAETKTSDGTDPAASPDA